MSDPHWHNDVAANLLVGAVAATAMFWAAVGSFSNTLFCGVFAVALTVSIYATFRIVSLTSGTESGLTAVSLYAKSIVFVWGLSFIGSLLWYEGVSSSNPALVGALARTGMGQLTARALAYAAIGFAVIGCTACTIAYVRRLVRRVRALERGGDRGT